ncbi:transposable element Tcb2 transposase [Trichonephila clavipes]|nr:transposable element Tcb2 transposase [Trichonephila clavipes]
MLLSIVSSKKLEISDDMSTSHLVNHQPCIGLGLPPCAIATHSVKRRKSVKTIDHLIGTSAHAPQRQMVSYTGMGTVGPDPHGLLAPLLGAPVSSRTIRRHLAEGQLGSRRPLRVLPLTHTHRHLRYEWCRARGNWTAAEWNQVVFSDESRFNFNGDDNRFRVWRPRAERLNPAFGLQRHTAPTAGVRVWDVIAYNTQSSLVLIRGTT